MYLDKETGELRRYEFRDGTLNYDTNKAGDESGICCEDISLAQQHQKDEADINVLVKRFGITDKDPVPNSIEWPWQSVDVSELHDVTLGDMILHVKAAQDAFMKLPAAVRGQFDNDATKFEGWVLDPENADQARKYGLRVPEVKREESYSGTGGSAGGAEGATAGGIAANGGAASGGS